MKAVNVLSAETGAEAGGSDIMMVVIVESFGLGWIVVCTLDFEKGILIMRGNKSLAIAHSCFSAFLIQQHFKTRTRSQS